MTTWMTCCPIRRCGPPPAPFLSTPSPPPKDLSPGNSHFRKTDMTPKNKNNEAMSCALYCCCCLCVSIISGRHTKWFSPYQIIGPEWTAEPIQKCLSLLHSNNPAKSFILSRIVGLFACAWESDWSREQKSQKNSIYIYKKYNILTITRATQN